FRYYLFSKVCIKVHLAHLCRDGRTDSGSCEGGRPLTIEVENRADMVQQLRETFHDLRQPVANMMALAAAALTEEDLPAAAQNRLKQITEQAEWLSDMIHNCLTQQQQQQQQQEEPYEIGKPRRDLADMARVVGEVIEAECLTWPGDMK